MTRHGISTQAVVLACLDPAWGQPINEQTQLVARFGQGILDMEEDIRGRHIRSGAREMVEWGQARLPPDHPLRFARVEDVPEDLALAAPFNIDTTIFPLPELVAWPLLMLPWLAHADGEELYLPRKVLDAYGWTWEPVTVRNQIEVYHEQAERPATL